MRKLLGHPMLSSEHYFSNEELFPELNERISFKNNKLSPFALKYMAKFITGKRVEEFSIYGGGMPLNQMKTDNLVLLNMSEKALHSSDLFILA
jgi:hypothetical protein